MREWQLPPERTESNLRWSASWRTHGPEVEWLLSDPDALARFVARCRLLAEAGSPPASRCEEPALTAPGTADPAARGLASMVGIG